MALLEALKSTILAVVRKKRKKEKKKIIKKKSLYFWVTSCHAKKSGWRWGLVSQHQVEGPSEVVCQRAAALVLCQGQEEGQEQKQQEEQLQWQCCPAHSMQEGAHTSRALLSESVWFFWRSQTLLKKIKINKIKCELKIPVEPINEYSPHMGCFFKFMVIWIEWTSRWFFFNDFFNTY